MLAFIKIIAKKINKSVAIKKSPFMEVADEIED